MADPWFKTTVIYEVDPRTFFDSNGDGRGDLAGLTEKLDYIAGLGIDTLWINPFFLSPDHDGGYDVSDYYVVDPPLGSLGDFVVFMEKVRSLGLRVIIELVANHTSSEHPWFQEALTSRDASTRDFYIWVDDPPADSPSRIVFTEDDDEPWTFHEPTGQYYLHRFLPEEPDLNHAHPGVRQEMLKIMGTWLRLGVDGLRLDAAPYVAEKSSDGQGIDGPHEYLRTMRSYVSERNPDAVLMAEADVEAKRLGEFFGEGDGDEMHLLLSFLASETIFLALARHRAAPLERMLESMTTPPRRGAYANFLRNHDELDLEMLSEEDRAFVMDTFAPDDDMRIYGRGIRRRPAPMLDGDQDWIRLAHSLTFSMPGVPVLRYGDEIGLGDDLSLPDRVPVRTPMQWANTANAGFSTAPADDLYCPVISEGPFGQDRVNVADQEADPDSLLNWTRRLIAARHEAKIVGTGEWELVETGNEAVLGLIFRQAGGAVVTLHNLSDRDQTVDANAYVEIDDPVALLSPEEQGQALRERADLVMGRFGYLWLQGVARGGNGSPR